MKFLLLNKCILYSVSKPIYHNFEEKKTILWNNLSMQGKVIFSLKNILLLLSCLFSVIHVHTCTNHHHVYVNPYSKSLRFINFSYLDVLKKSWDLHIWLVTWQLQINHRNVWWYLLLHNLINADKCYRIFSLPITM